MKLCFAVGSCRFAVESEYELSCDGLFQGFAVPDCGAVDLTFRVSYRKALPPCEGAIPFGGCRTCTVQGKDYRFYADSRTGDPFACVEETPSGVLISVLDSAYPWGTSVEQLFPLLSLQHTLLQSDHLLMHGAFLTVGAQGLMFTGPSGIGKTTQSRLWQNRFAAEAVNEDRTVIDLRAEPVRICGVPVAGSSPFCGNETAPLKAIIVLGQSKENEISRLSPAKALPRLMDSVYLPRGFEGDKGLCMELALRLCTAVPVYRLDCRPDIQSAELTYDTLFGEDA